MSDMQLRAAESQLCSSVPIRANDAEKSGTDICLLGHLRRTRENAHEISGDHAPLDIAPRPNLSLSRSCHPRSAATASAPVCVPLPRQATVAATTDMSPQPWGAPYSGSRQKVVSACELSGPSSPSGACSLASDR
jgi:hypothetical protein